MKSAEAVVPPTPRPKWVETRTGRPQSALPGRGPDLAAVDATPGRDGQGDPEDVPALHGQAEQDGDDLKLRKSHASSPDSLDGIRQMFERTTGRYPIEELKEARR